MPYKDKELQKQSQTIFQWKKRGMKFETMDEAKAIYQKYKVATKCEVCSKSFEDVKKHLDHDHETGQVRNIVCCHCNWWRQDYRGNDYDKWIKKRFRKDRNKDYFFIKIMRNKKNVLSTKTTSKEKAVEIVDNFILNNPNFFT